MKRTASQLVINLSFFCMDVCNCRCGLELIPGRSMETTGVLTLNGIHRSKAPATCDSQVRKVWVRGEVQQMQEEIRFAVHHAEFVWRAGAPSPGVVSVRTVWRCSSETFAHGDRETAIRATPLVYRTAPAERRVFTAQQILLQLISGSIAHRTACIPLNVLRF
jgi:hypothetical protein